MGLLGDEQAGFRDGYSTLDHIFVLDTIINIYLSKKKRLCCAFVDLKKAFDLVDRSSLLGKLIGSGINGKVITVLYNLYHNAKSSLLLDGRISEPFTCNIGLRQGENLSPILFAIYLNDFEFFVSRTYKGLDTISNDVRNILSDEDVEVYLRLYVMLYADDTVVMAESTDDLQRALNATYSYCDRWKLTVNTNKTKVVVFSRGKIRNKPKFNFGRDTLEVVDSYVYLGILFNYNGNHKRCIAKQVSQARKALYSMLSKVCRLKLPVDIQCDLFEKLVLPILLYGCEIWGCDDITQVEVFYRNS